MASWSVILPTPPWFWWLTDNRGQGVQAWAATQPLKQAGVQLSTNTAASGVRKVHHKLMVHRRAPHHRRQLQLHRPAATLSDENIIVLGDLEETSAAAETTQRTIAGYALTQINRIIATLSQPV
jgi:hypothetical protein